eukprot:TRINITY_DN799_c0_g1_i1.p1 TRINITY_DN799_c0_g1~~TRINITY_DN799_c0_g1_i1.p1  ORF type:complete len:1445 (-),score=361.51 TRINITY_DN799_c0_g1_i1:290-4624(-)
MFRRFSKAPKSEKQDPEERVPLTGTSTPRASIDLGSTSGNPVAPAGSGEEGSGSKSESGSGFGFSLPFGGSSTPGDKKDKKKDKDSDGKGKDAKSKDKDARETITAADEEIVMAEFKDGDYVVQVHIIEARGLKPRDMSGTSDPICVVEAFGMKYSTEVKKKVLSCVWDRTFIFEEKNMQAIDVECSKVNVSVFDHNGISRNELIGSYEFGMSYVYNQKNHEIWRVWVPLTDVTDENEGVQGYVKLSVAVLGPGDEIKVHTEQEEKERDGQEAILSSPKIKQEGHLLMVDCHMADGLPKVDSMGKCDPYLSVVFAGNPPCETSHKEKTLTPVWGEGLEIPVMLPIMTDVIEVGLWDHERVGSNRLLASFFLRYSDVPKNLKADQVVPRWYNLYGPQIGTSNELAKKMSQGRVEGTTYYGRALLSIYDVPMNEPKLNTRKLEIIKTSADVRISQYYLRLDLYEAAELPFESGTVQVILAWGTYDMKAEGDIKNGRAVFTSLFPEIKATFPEDVTQCPDVFIYIDKIDMLGSAKRVAYCRFKFSDLRDDVVNPSWFIFKEDKVIDAIPRGEFPGCVLMKLVAGKTPNGIPVERPPLVRMKMTKYIVRANIYQGRNLIAADDDGLSDPYIILKVGGQKVRTEVRYKTLFPVWNQVLEASADFPENLAFAPEIQVLVYDKDVVSKDDFMGRFSVNVSNLGPGFVETPKWYSLSMEDYNFPMGEILASFQVIPQKEISSHPIMDIRPMTKPARVEIFVIGMRNLEPFRLLPIQNPFIEFDVGDRAKAGRYRTERSKRPSGQNPNFLKAINLELDIPLSKLYSPTLNMKVYDRRAGGAFTPMIGVSTVSLEHFVPWMNEQLVQDTGSGVGSGEVKKKKKPKKIFGSMGFSMSLQGIDLGLSQNSDEEEGKSEGSRLSRLLPVPKIGTENIRAAAKVLDRNASAAIGGVMSVFREPIYPKDDFEVRVELGEAAEPEYLKDRIRLDDEMEDNYDLNPFHEFIIMRGMQVNDDILPSFIMQNEAVKAITDALDNDSSKQVGRFKGFVRVHSEGTPSPPPPFDLQSLMGTQPYVIRVYILKGIGLSPRDDNGFSDPYIVLELGNTKITNRDNKQEKTLDPEFFECHELTTTLPGPSILTVSVFDYDLIGSDELIGSTEIDLENRWFSKEWKAFKNKPLENRTLKIATSRAPQGKLQMWVDIIPRAEAHKHPKIDIAPPPKEDFEVRLIIWRARYMVNKDSITDQNDLYITADLTGCKKDRTDVHLRAKEGKGSFNYRMIFPVKLPMKNPRLTLAAWDFDVFAPNDIIGEVTLDLDHLFKAAYHKKLPVPLSRKDPNYEGPAKVPERDEVWLEVYNSDGEPQGQVCISLEIMPKEFAEINPAGPKRDEPNINPVLDPPDRIKFDIFSPLQMIKELLGPDLYGRIARPLMCLCCIVIFVGIAFLLNQFAGIAAILK